MFPLVYYSDFFVCGAGELAGAALVVGLGVTVGSATVGLGEATGVDAGVVGALEFGAGSHAVANTDARTVGSSSARLIDLVVGLFIDIPRSSKIEKREDNCSNVSS
jgi:hypothetical protein